MGISVLVKIGDNLCITLDKVPLSPEGGVTTGVSNNKKQKRGGFFFFLFFFKVFSLAD